MYFVWILFGSVIIHTSRCLPPEVPSTPLWNNLKLEKPRSSLVPAWYDVLVTPQISNQNQTVSYADLRESFSLDKLNLPEVVQKNVVLEAEEVEIPDDKNVKKPGTKLRNLFKNTFSNNRKEMKYNALTVATQVETQAALRKIKESKTPTKVPSLDEKVPLYIPIFRHRNNKQKPSERLLEKPDFGGNEEENTENQEKEFDADVNVEKAVTASINKGNMIPNEQSTEEKPHGLEKNVRKVKNKTKKGVKSIQRNNEGPTSEIMKELDQSNIHSVIAQAIKDGKLKLNTKAISSKPFHLIEKVYEQTKQASISDVPSKTFQSLMPQNTLNPYTVDPESQIQVPQSMNFPIMKQENMNLNPESQLKLTNQQNNQTPLEKGQSAPKSGPVVTLFKPDTVSLWETYGNFLKQLTMTVLVPVHVEMLLTGGA